MGAVCRVKAFEIRTRGIPVRKKGGTASVFSSLWGRFFYAKTVCAFCGSFEEAGLCGAVAPFREGAGGWLLPLSTTFHAERGGGRAGIRIALALDLECLTVLS